MGFSLLVVGEYLEEQMDRFHVSPEMVYKPVFINSESYHRANFVEYCEHFPLENLPFEADNFDDYMREFVPYIKFSEEHGCYGVWGNPNTKLCDWALGGNYANSLVLKAEVALTAHRRCGISFTPKNISDAVDRCDQCKVGDINFNAMSPVLLEGELTVCDEVKPFIEKHQDNLPTQSELLNFNAASTSPLLQDLIEAEYSPDDAHIRVALHFALLKLEENEAVGMTEGTGLPTSAFLKDGVWVEALNNETYRDQFWEMLKGLHPSTLISIVDCSD